MHDSVNSTNCTATACLDYFMQPSLPFITWYPTCDVASSHGGELTNGFKSYNFVIISYRTRVLINRESRVGTRARCSKVVFVHLNSSFGPWLPARHGNNQILHYESVAVQHKVIPPVLRRAFCMMKMKNAARGTFWRLSWAWPDIFARLLTWRLDDVRPRMFVVYNKNYTRSASCFSQSHPKVSKRHLTVARCQSITGMMRPKDTVSWDWKGKRCRQNMRTHS